MWHIKIDKKIKQEVNIWDLIDWLENESEICLDIETEGLNYLTDKIAVIALGNATDVWIIEVHKEDRKKLYMLLCELKDKLIIGHNLLFDISFLRYNTGCDTGMWNIHDTYQVEQLITKGMNTQRSYKALVEDYCGVELDKTEQTSFKHGEELNDDQIQYIINDIIFLPSIRDAQKEYIEEYSVSWLVDMENRLTPILAEFSVDGILYDVERHNKNTELYKKQAADVVDSIHAFLIKMYKKYNLDQPTYSKDFTVKRPNDIKYVNLASPVQLLTLMHQFDKSISSTRKATLEKYLMNGTNTDLSVLITLLLKLRAYNKLVSTYGESFLTAVNNGVIRTNLQQNTAITGRFISSDIKQKGRKHKVFANLQNLPQRAEIRECFIARSGYKLITLDLSGAELKILGAFSNDEEIKQGVEGKIDLHSNMATLSYREITGDPTYIVSQEVNADKRKKHKPALFALIYGASEARISEVLNIPKAKAKKVYNILRKYLDTAFNYLDSTVKDALNTGVIRANEVSNRFVYLEEYMAYKSQGVLYPNRHRIVRQLYNFQMQATNADMLKYSIIKLYEYFNTIKEYDCRIKMTVYDEIVFAVPEKELWIVDEAKDIIIEACNLFLKNGVTMSCNVIVANHWIK